MNPRNFLALIALFIVLIVGFVLVGNLLNALVPLIVTAIIAFILGRLSVRMNLLDFIRSARAGRTAAQQSGILKTAESLIEKAVPAVKASAPAATAKPTPPVEKEAEIPQRPVNPDLLLDPNFEIKTSEQVEAEARLREQEAMKRAASTDVNAALEERRKRLLGNKGDGS